MNWISPLSIVIISLIWELAANRGKLNVKSLFSRIAGSCIISVLLHMATSCGPTEHERKQAMNERIAQRKSAKLEQMRIHTDSCKLKY